MYMEQMEYLLTEYAVYITAVWAAVMFLFAAVTLHRINKLIRLRKKELQSLQDEISGLRLQIEIQAQQEAESQLTREMDSDEKYEAEEREEGWTTEEETLVNAVLGEVFS